MTTPKDGQRKPSEHMCVLIEGYEHCSICNKRLINLKSNKTLDGEPDYKALCEGLAEALGFYASPNNWFDGNNSTPIEKDDGVVARMALEEFKGTVNKLKNHI